MKDPKSRIAFVGTVGIPNVYGGFESFLESCAPHLAASRIVTVTCDSSRYDDHAATWQGVQRIFLPISANGASAPLHDALAFLKVFWRHDIIVFLGVPAGLLFPFFRAACSAFGKLLVVNVDGVEWRRGKHNVAKRLFLRLSDAIAQIASHVVVADNTALIPFLATKRVQRRARLIAYPGDHVVHVQVPQDAEMLLTVCRIEPENNCEMLLEAFSAAGRGSYTFVGNWENSAYGRELRSRFGATPGLRMLDPIYDPVQLGTLRSQCAGYVHGHSVGGTNPSLVEMLFYDCPIAAYDCSFNREVAGADASYFRGAKQLSLILRSFMTGKSHRGPKVSRLAFTRAQIVASYEKIFVEHEAGSQTTQD